MPRTLLSIDHHDSRSITPLVPMLGGLMAVLVWFGVWWDLGLAQDLLPSILHNLPRGAEVSQTVAATMMAIGVAGVFIETHPDPDQAPSDGPNMIRLADMPALIATLMELDRVAKANPVSID